MRTMAVTLCLILTPSLSTGQEDTPETRAQIDSLLDRADVESLIESLDERFVTHFLMLVPDLPSEDRDALTVAVTEAFRPSVVRTNIATSMAADASRDDVGRVLDMHRTGRQAELRRLVDEYEPEQSLEEFAANLVDVDRERLQLMASLGEARRESEVELILDEALRQVAHDLANAMGGDVGDFAPTPDDVFDAAYRDRTLSLALESLHRFQPASNELIVSVLDEYLTDEARWFADSYLASLVAAVGAAGQYVAGLTVAAAPDIAPEPTPMDPSSAPPCRRQECGLLVQWDGSEPTSISPAYGAPGDFERFVRQELILASYQLVRGEVDQGLTIRIRPRTMRARCEVISGTNNRTCLAVGQVRVEFMGSYPGHETPNPFLVRNRCGANSFMMAQGIASLVAARLHYELTTFPGDERTVPGC